ncbi:hypothetical protein [Deinococcus marmoris]|uniref:hypothetical protein n=1 Tax=Deinococcus marmoris TaxID=249408 RepID=UPI00158D32E2|nr:hypothetical protein [Deinococcus marmoris]
MTSWPQHAALHPAWAHPIQAHRRTHRAHSHRPPPPYAGQGWHRPTTGQFTPTTSPSAPTTGQFTPNMGQSAPTLRCTASPGSHKLSCRQFHRAGLHLK